MQIREATPADNEALQAIQANCPMGASLIVSTVNTPDFFGRAKAYEWYRVYVAEEGGEIIGSAACAIREGLIDGRSHRIGYEFQYFTAPEARHRGVASRLHHHIEAVLDEEAVSLSYLIILEGNVPSMRLFEGLGFIRHCAFPMAALIVYQEMETLPMRGNARPAALADLDQIAALRDATWDHTQLYEPMNGRDLYNFIGRTPAYDLENLAVIAEGDEILAAAGYWDWSQITEIVVEKVSAKIKVIGWGLEVAGWVRRTPSGIKAGDRLEQVVITPIAYRDPVFMGPLLHYINNRCLEAGVGQIFLAAPPGHPLLAQLDGFINIGAEGYLYVKALQPGISLGDGPVFISGKDL